MAAETSILYLILWQSLCRPTFFFYCWHSHLPAELSTRTTTIVGRATYRLTLCITIISLTMTIFNSNAASVSVDLPLIVAPVRTLPRCSDNVLHLWFSRNSFGRFIYWLPWLIFVVFFLSISWWRLGYYFKIVKSLLNSYLLTNQNQLRIPFGAV
jgi:hypothetical protein